MNIIFTNTNELQDQKTIHDTIVKNLFASSYSTSNIDYANICKKISDFLKELRNDLFIVIETEYVDKDYRDAYYRLYATKFKEHPRNCIRLSFFESKLESLISDFSKVTDFDTIEKGYLGFLILRPLKQCIGRNVISPIAFNNSPISICGTSVNSSCMGLKLQVWGFPHSSQDGQMLTCAETTIWAISDYFAEKYSLYSRVFPHNILDLLHDSTFQRQLPSIGLSYQMISLALQRQGLDCRAYHKNNPMFKEIFTCYVESEFPLALAIQNSDIGHALVCIGRKEISRSTIVSQDPVVENGKSLRFWNKGINDFVSIDDNCPPYRIFSFEKPTNHYGMPNWTDTEITCFIVPLHPKIYLEAEKAIALSNELVKFTSPMADPVVKTFLTTSRSFKNYILMNPNLRNVDKEVLIQLDAPKFVWLTEVSSVGDFLNSKVGQLILIDPTADNTCTVQEALIANIIPIAPIPSFENLKIK